MANSFLFLPVGFFYVCCMENDYSTYFEANRQNWNQRTAVEKDSAFYDVAGFKTGKNMLTPIGLNEVGDVKEKKMLHLQCQFGIDSLCWARMGAAVTGVDLSDAAINEAKKLNDQSGLMQYLLVLIFMICIHKLQGLRKLPL